MIHARVQPAEANGGSRYRPRGGLDPTALGVVVLLHLLGLAAIATHRIAAEAKTEVRMELLTFDLAPPPPPTDPDIPEQVVPPPPAVHIPPPIVPVALVRPPTLAVMTEPPPPEPPSEPRPAASPTVVPVSRPMAGGDLSTSMVHAPPPRYPRESRRRREQGTVLLALVLGVDGSVTEIRVARSSGFARLDEAALDAVRRWRWSPTVRNGVAVPIRGTVEIPFVLTG
ncbi:energy transducer TonB [Sphingomonas flavalba]|uniref:energy transducer TonB n=1 Tax=Sphingomonas flavalba TaxID=2559804 RepID=UPI0039E1117D